MYEHKKNGKVFTSKFFGTGPPSYEKRIYRAAVSQRLRTSGIIAVVTRLQTGTTNVCSSPGKVVRFFALSKWPSWLWDPTNPLFNRDPAA